MSIRIHELAKKIGLDNKSLLALLKERNYDVKTASSTIDNISAEALEAEFAEKTKAAEAPAAEKKPDEKPAPPPQKPRIPMVKSAEDVQREKDAAAAKLAAEKAAATGTPAPAAKAPAPAPAAAKSPAPVPAPKAPKPVAPVSAPKPVSVPPRPAATPSAPRPPAQQAAAPAAQQAAAPAPLKTPGLRPPAPPPETAAPAKPAAVSAPPPPAPRPVSTPRPVPAPRAPMPIPTAPRQAAAAPAAADPAAPAQLPSNVTISNEGDIKVIHIKPPIILRDFAVTLGMRPFKLISELMEMGIFASMNQTIEDAVASKVAEKHGYLLEVKYRGAGKVAEPKISADEKKKKAEEEEAKNLEPRPPIVCILGHVDHGKTSLLDVIRKAHVAKGEAGGITQHIGAYQIEHAGKKITFLDTPGHSAFNKMRARGASLTDIAILVVAADDGFMPQTDEALKYIQEAGVALMVAVNKMDVKGANLDRVKTQMQERNIAPEDWGGTTPLVPVSALKGTGINELLESILLHTEILVDPKANPKAPASGIIIESQIDIGRGPLSTVIIQRGTLRVGDSLVCGQHWARVRALFDDQGKPVKEAPPAMPVRVIGWNSTPESGGLFKTVKNAREAEKLAEAEEHRLKQTAATAQSAATAKDGFTVEDLFKDIAAQQHKTLKVLIKTDVFGSTEAVRSVLEGIKSTKVTLEIVGIDVGMISKSDVLMAGSAGAAIIGFNTKLENGVTPLAKHHGVRIETYGIIYELGDKVRDMMADLLDPDIKEVKTGVAEIRETFPLGKGFVAGCLVTEGKINRNAASRIRRKKEIVFEGKISTLKRFKDDANEVRAGLECGIKVGDFNAYEKGDLIECYEIQKVRATL